MPRIFKILLTQFQQLSLNDFIMLILKNIYQSDPLLIYAYNLKNFTKDTSSGSTGYDILKGAISELETAKAQIKPIPWEFQCNLFDNVSDFFVAKDRNGIQCICWIYYFFDHNRILKMGPSEAEIKFCLTLPDARGKSLYPLVVREILGYLRDKGMTRAYMCVLKDNKPSIRGIEKAGFTCIGKFNLRKAFGIQLSKRFITKGV